MLKLGWSLSVQCHWCPFILPQFVFVVSHVNHRLNSEYMPWFHYPNCFVFSVMWDGRRTVEHHSASVSTVSSNYWMPFFFNISAYQITDLSVHYPWLAEFNYLLQRIVSIGDQLFWRFRGILTNEECLIEIAMIPFEVHWNVNITDIPILEWSQVWNSMTDHLIHRSNIVRKTYVQHDLGKP